jgi:hypothetical protein
MVIIRYNKYNKQSIFYLISFEGDAVDWLALMQLVLFILRSFVFYQSMQMKVRITS